MNPYWIKKYVEYGTTPFRYTIECFREGGHTLFECGYIGIVDRYNPRLVRFTDKFIKEFIEK